jgi:hypothetical protein
MAHLERLLILQVKVKEVAQLLVQLVFLILDYRFALDDLYLFSAREDLYLVVQ